MDVVEKACEEVRKERRKAFTEKEKAFTAKMLMLKEKAARNKDAIL